MNTSKIRSVIDKFKEQSDSIGWEEFDREDLDVLMFLVGEGAVTSFIETESYYLDAVKGQIVLEAIEAIGI